MENLFKDLREYQEDVVHKIEGEIPDWLNGTLIRTGPGKWDLDETFTMNHFLDGCAMMVKFEFNQKEKIVRARTRFLNSDAYQKCCTQKRPVFTEFGTPAFTDQSKSIFSRVFNKLVPSDLTDNDISNIYKVNDDEVYVTTESCNIWRIDPKSLDSLQKINLDKKPGIAISCSHPILDEDEQAVYNVGCSFLTGMKYHIMKVPVDGKKKNQTSSFENSSIVCSFSSSYKGSFAYIHSFAMTKNYVILIEQSLLCNSLKLATCTPKGKSLEECLEWCPEEPSRFHIFDKRTKSMVKHKFETKGFFYFHSINSYEQDNQIVLDLLTYEDIGLFEALRLKNLRAGKYNTTSKSKPTRYVLPLGDRKEMKKNVNLVTVDDKGASAIMNDRSVIELVGRSLGPEGCEMPTVNQKYIGKPYNYIYATGLFEKGFYENAVAKIDLKNNKAITYKFSETSYAGEGVFIAAPNAKEEDDGIILSLVLETDMKKSPFLTVLDAKDLRQMAIIELDRNKICVPPTLHGLWLPNNKDAAN